MKNLLIIGGTQMVGRDFIEFCIENNSEYDISLANRGITNPSLFSHLKHIRIDRNTERGCSGLDKANYDIVIDFSCYNSQQLYSVLKYTHYSNYFLMSTLTVLDQSALSDKNNSLHKYALDKKLLEEYVLTNNLPITIVRTGAMFGKNDYTNRYYELDNKFYSRFNNQEIKESKYILNVRTFTTYLHDYVSKNSSQRNTVIEINRDGIIENR